MRLSSHVMSQGYVRTQTMAASVYVASFVAKIGVEVGRFARKHFHVFFFAVAGAFVTSA